MIFKLVFTILLFLIHTASAAEEPPKPFITDGCSNFFDGGFSDSEQWLDCCTEHDLAYWRGGSKQERLLADQKFKQCIAERANPILAELMYRAVRLFGHPHNHADYRWGYGYAYGDGYR